MEMASEVEDLLITEPTPKQSSLRFGLGLVAGAAIVCAGAAAVFATGRTPVKAPLSSTVELNVEHITQWGPVPHSLMVDGFECPTGAHKEANGLYEFAGLTEDGHAYWKNHVSSHVLYYDRKCEKPISPQPHAARPPTQHGPMPPVPPVGEAWNIAKSDGFEPEKEESLAGQCGVAVTWNGGTGKLPPLPSHGLPAPYMKWSVKCGEYDALMPIRVKIVDSSPQPKSHVSGEWEFLGSGAASGGPMAPPGLLEVKTGAVGKKPGPADIVGAEFGLGDADRWGDIAGRLSEIWEQEASAPAGSIGPLSVPPNKGVWQWVFRSKGGPGSCVVRTKYLAITEMTKGPKCYPGMSRDGLGYMMCDGPGLPPATGQFR